MRERRLGRSIFCAPSLQRSRRPAVPRARPPSRHTHPLVEAPSTHRPIPLRRVPSSSGRAHKSASEHARRETREDVRAQAHPHTRPRPRRALRAACQVGRRHPAPRVGGVEGAPAAACRRRRRKPRTPQRSPLLQLSPPHPRESAHTHRSPPPTALCPRRSTRARSSRSAPGGARRRATSSHPRSRRATRSSSPSTAARPWSWGRRTRRSGSSSATTRSSAC
jgi:hypothetical protein